MVTPILRKRKLLRNRSTGLAMIYDILTYRIHKCAKISQTHHECQTGWIICKLLGTFEIIMSGRVQAVWLRLSRELSFLSVYFECVMMKMLSIRVQYLTSSSVSGVGMSEKWLNMWTDLSCIVMLTTWAPNANWAIPSPLTAPTTPQQPSPPPHHHQYLVLVLANLTSQI